MSSILDDVKLDVFNFEGAIAVGMKPGQITKMFNKTSKEMDDWCMATYGKNYSTTCEILRQVTYREFMTTVKNLGYRGNPSALNIINNAINDMQASNVTKIVFENAVQKEKESDDGDESDTEENS